jgi:hypothetical protein
MDSFVQEGHSVLNHVVGKEIVSQFLEFGQFALSFDVVLFFDAALEGRVSKEKLEKYLVLKESQCLRSPTLIPYLEAFEA